MKTGSLALSALVACTVAACSVASDPSAVSTEALGGLPTGMSWTGWSPLPGGLVTDPTIVNIGPAHLNAAATGPDGNVYTNWFNGSRWSGWQNIGNNGSAIKLAPSSVVVPVNNGSDIALFAIDSSGELLEKIGNVVPGYAPNWSNVWVRILPPGSHSVATNGPPTVVVSQPNNQINVFVTLDDHTAAVARGYLAFFSWTMLSGGVLYQPGAVSWGPNRLDVFVAGTNNALYHRYSNDAGVTWLPAGGWWEPLGGKIYTTPQVVSWGPNRLDAFAGGYTNNVGTIEHMAWTGNAWSAWEALPGAVWGDGPQNVPQNVATPTPITMGVGQMEVFVQGQNGALVDLSMTAQASGATPTQWSTGIVASCFRNAGKPAVTPSNGSGFAVAVTGFDPSGDTSVWVNSTGWPLPASGAPAACPAGVLGATCNLSSSNPNVNACNSGEICANGACAMQTPASCAQASKGWGLVNLTARYNDLSFKITSPTNIKWGWKVTSGNLDAQGEVSPGAGGILVDLAEHFAGPPYAIYPNTLYTVTFYPGGLTSTCPKPSITFKTPYDTIPPCVIDHNCPNDPGAGDGPGDPPNGGVGDGLCEDGSPCCSQGLCSANNE